MVRGASVRGSFPGFSTNGLLLTERLARDLLQAGVRYMAFSIDGATESTYRSVRGSALRRVCENVRRLVALRGDACDPQLSLTFVMLKNNLDQVPDVVRLAHDLGVDFVRLKKVDVFTLEDYRQITYDYAAPYDPDAPLARRQTTMLAEAVRLGREQGIGVQVPRTRGPGLPFCWMEPEHTVFVNSRGEIAPCCILGHASLRLDSRPALVRHPPWTVASLAEGAAGESLQLESYARFLANVTARVRPAICERCPKVTPGPGLE